MQTSVSNKLIILRDQYGFSQQYVADYLNISKSTYCRYEKGTSSPDIYEINALLNLYDISYYEFTDISLPIKHTLVYPAKLLDKLEAELLTPEDETNSYTYYKEKYDRIQNLLNPLFDISTKAFSFPNIDISCIPRNTTVKEVTLDMRGELLIRKALVQQEILFKKMTNCLYYRDNK